MSTSKKPLASVTDLWLDNDMSTATTIIELYCTRMGCQWSSDIDIESPHLSTLIEVAEMHVQRNHTVGP